MASYEYKSLNLKDYINQLYNDGLKKSVYLTENEIEDLIYQMGIFKFKGYVRAFKQNLKNYKIEDVLFLYFFDRLLSKELLNLCLTFESKLKSILVENSYKLTSNPFFYLVKSSYIDDRFKLKNEILDNWKEKNYPNNEEYTHYHQYYLHTYSFEKNKEVYLKNETLLYSDTDINFPPFHYLVESSTFGIIKGFINNLAINDNILLNNIAREFGFYQGQKFKSYIERVNEIRNRCAHNGRVFNRTYRSVTALGKYKTFRSENISLHGVIDVYLTLYFLLNRIDNFENFNEFVYEVIEELFKMFKCDYETKQLSKNLITSYNDIEFDKLKNFILKGMGIKKLNVQAEVQCKC